MRRLAAAAALALVPAAAHAASKAENAGTAAYVYGLPPIAHQLSQQTFPVNQLVGIASLSGPENKLIVRPNVDTVYTVGKLDLRAEPVIVDVPAVPDRYYSFQLMDAYTNVFAYIGSRTTGSAAGRFALTAPGWVGELSPAVTRIESPTPDVLLLGRTLVRSPEDLPAVKELIGRYAAGPASAEPKSSIVLDEAPVRDRPVVPQGMDFLDAVGAALAANPPPKADRKFLARLKPYGIGPGLKTSEAGLTGRVREDVLKGVALGPARLNAVAAAAERNSAREHEGWTLLDPDVGDYGTDYSLRAMTALIGLWANTPAEATYPLAGLDSRNRPLSGRHRYVLRFAKGELPPVDAFWSLTMYDRAGALYANPIDRYALGDRSPGLRRDAGGGLTFRLQHDRPAAGQVANWLPAPAGRFSVMLRLYIPKQAAVNGRWTPPPITRSG